MPSDLDGNARRSLRRLAGVLSAWPAEYGEARSGLQSPALAGAVPDWGILQTLEDVKADPP